MTTLPNKKVIIYIPLLDEGVPVSRPTYGEVIGANLFRVLPTEGYDPSIETWKFPPGTVVKCEKKIRDGKELLVAIDLYEAPDEFTAGS